MGLIEQAAKRLEQLRNAGVELHDIEKTPLTPSPATNPQSSEYPARQRQTSSVVAQSDTPLSSIDVASDSNTEFYIEPKSAKFVSLSLEAMAASGLLTPTASRSTLADEFRVIKRPLIANAMGKGVEAVANGNLIMVTSALPGEGKSFSAINLAISVAMELDNTVMLVDADVARPSVLTMLGLPNAPGLLDVVAQDSVDISEVLLKTNIEKLSILPSGTQHSRATELLASDAMVRLLDDMASRYPDRIIIFDSPPLLLTTEARALATHMGQVVMVVHAGKTEQKAVKEAIATIESCPVKMMLLNQSRHISANRYGYGYGYGYGNNAN